MKTRFFLCIAIIGLLMVTFTSCNNSGKGFKLTGTLQGINEGKIILKSTENMDTPADTVDIINGKFEFTGVVTEPSTYFLMLEGKPQMISLYVENSEITITGSADSLNKAKIVGSQTQDDYINYQQKQKELSEKFKLEELQKEMYPKPGQDTLSTERKAEIDAIYEKFSQESDNLTMNFIKENPKSYFSVVLIGRMTYGMGASEIEKYVNLLDPKIAALPSVKKMLENLTQMKQTEVGVDAFIKDAHNLSYAVDNSYGGKKHLDVVYLSILSNNNICALKENGTVCIIDQKGASVREFKTDLKAASSSMAIDKSDNIYVLGTLMGKVKIKSRGRSVEVDKAVGVECAV